MTIYSFLSNALAAVSKVLSNQRIVDLLFVFLGLGFIATVPCIVRYFICGR